MMGSGYAKSTYIEVRESLVEVDELVKSFGGSSFSCSIEMSRATITFRYKSRTVGFDLPLPDACSFAETPSGRKRSPTKRQEAWAQASRERWRSIILLIKALFVAVEDGLIHVDKAFVVLP